MIPNAILSLLTTILGAAFSLLPTSSFTFLNGLSATLDAPITTMMSAAAAWDFIVPLGDFLDLTHTWIMVVLPAVLTYRIASWVWRHIPEIAGFGPGAG